MKLKTLREALLEAGLISDTYLNEVKIDKYVEFEYNGKKCYRNHVYTTKKEPNREYVTMDDGRKAYLSDVKKPDNTFKGTDKYCNLSNDKYKSITKGVIRKLFKSEHAKSNLDIIERRLKSDNVSSNDIDKIVNNLKNNNISHYHKLKVDSKKTKHNFVAFHLTTDGKQNSTANNIAIFNLDTSKIEFVGDHNSTYDKFNKMYT